MTKYRIKLMSKDELYIEEAEYQKLIASKAKGLVFISSLKGTVNMNSVETILPADLVPKEELTEGRLHDGTRVIKQFGRWVDQANPNVTLDASYYPEIATDAVVSHEDYENGVRPETTAALGRGGVKSIGELLGDE